MSLLAFMSPNIPLEPYKDEIRRMVSHYSSTLGKAYHDEKVTVAGLVGGIRRHQTKAGKMMAWITLEDLSGVIELVLFPHIWKNTSPALK